MNEIILLHEQRNCPIVSHCASAPNHSNHAKFTVLILCMLALLGAIPSFCQTAMNPERTGVVPYGTYESTNVDHIDMSNGRVYLTIPLYSLPQKGSLSLSFSATISGATTYNAQAINCTTSSCQYNYGLGSSIGVGIGFDQALCLMPVVPSRTIFTEAGDDGAGGQWEDGYMDIAYIHQVMDGAGNLHYLGYDPSTGYMTLRSADGSGYLEQLSDPNGYKDGATGPIYDAKGIRYDSAEITDPNGNHMTYPSSSGIITDSLGRSVSDEPNGPAVDISNCPDLNNPSQPVTSAQEWDLPGPTDAGGTVKYIICYTKFYYHTNFLLRNGASYQSTSGYPPVVNTYREATAQVTVVQSIVNPDGTAWSFEYDGSQDSSAIAYGDLLKVHLPNGGTISYTYQTAPTCTPEEEGYPRGNVNPPFEPYSRIISSRTLTQLDGSTQTWNYAVGIDAPNYDITSTVARPDGNSTVYEFSPLNGSECNYVETGRTDYQGGVVKRTTQKTYFAQEVPQFIRDYQKDYYYAKVGGTNILYADFGTIPPLEVPFLHTVTTTLDQGPPTTTTYTYDAGLTNVQPWCNLENDVNQNDCQWDFTHRTAHSLLGRVTSVSTTGSDGHGGTLTSTKTTAYQAFNGTGITNSAYYNANLLDFPHVVSVTGSAGNFSDTTYNYDESNGSPAGVHGNLTSTVVNGGAPTSTVYNTQGMPTTSIDGNGKSTIYTYGDASSISPTSVCLPSTASGTYTHCSSYTWDPNTGEMLTYIDQNTVLTKYTYNDGLGRVTKIDAAVGTPSERITTFTYPTPSNPDVTSVAADKDVLNDGKIKSSTTVDGFGRTIRTTNAAGAIVDTTYDSVGNVASVSNPYFSTSDSTYGITSFAYDALGRKIDQCQQDNSASASTTCTPASSYQQWQYSGNTVTFTDESGKKWVRTSDALGRLAEVVEDPAGLNLETDYQYDSLGNLASVTQWGGPSGSPNPRTRTFSYDSLSHLVQAFNPETGWVCYGTTPSNAPANGSNCTEDYDGNSNLKAKTDARGVQIAYGYDELNRLTSKTYSDGTPTALFVYDVPNITFNSTNRFTTSNVNGRLSVICVSVPGACQSMTAYSYDAMGRTTETLNSTPFFATNPTVYTVSSTYDLAGDRLSLANSASRTFNYTYDGAGQLQTASNTVTLGGVPVTTPMVSSVSYYASGQPYVQTTTTGSASVTGTWGLDKRLRVTSYSNLSSANPGYTSYGYSLSYTPNGNVATSSETTYQPGVGPKSWSWTNNYDALNRLINSTSSGAILYGCAETYDPFGNRTEQAPYGGAGYSCTPKTTLVSANNRLSDPSYNYDAAGDMLSDGSNVLTYDAEGRITSSTPVGGPTTSYLYAADGERMSKVSGGVETDYMRDTDGSLLVTYVNGSYFGQPQEMWVGGRHFGTVTVASGGGSQTQNFSLTNWLGSERREPMPRRASRPRPTSANPSAMPRPSCSAPMPMIFTSPAKNGIARAA